MWVDMMVQLHGMCWKISIFPAILENNFMRYISKMIMTFEQDNNILKGQLIFKSIFGWNNPYAVENWLY